MKDNDNQDSKIVFDAENQDQQVYLDTLENDVPDEQDIRVPSRQKSNLGVLQNTAQIDKQMTIEDDFFQKVIISAAAK